jgi:hypothetical protein
MERDRQGNCPHSFTLLRRLAEKARVRLVDPAAVLLKGRFLWALSEAESNLYIWQGLS